MIKDIYILSLKKNLLGCLQGVKDLFINVILLQVWIVFI